jgi:predicted cupin superfamily sugar epimerase
MSKVQEYIKNLSLISHPEGGYYASTYKSLEVVSAACLPDRFNGERVFSTAIFFLLEGFQYSAFHRIKSDELWHFYDGCALDIYVIHPSGKGEILRLGADIANGESFQQLVPAGCWFASRPVMNHGFTLAGCTVSPGFDFTDFEMANKSVLLSEFPQYANWINELSIGKE